MACLANLVARSWIFLRFCCSRYYSELHYTCETHFAFILSVNQGFVVERLQRVFALGEQLSTTC